MIKKHRLLPVLATLLIALMPLASDMGAPSPARAQEKTEKGFDINFTNLALEDVIKTYAKWMGKNFLLTDKLKGASITVYSERKVSKDEAWRVFESILRANGYTIVPGREVNRIVPVADAMSDLIPTYSTEDLVYGSRNFSYVTRLFPLKYVSASEMKGVVTKFLSKGADVMEYAPTNLLIITESSAHINRVIKILKELDVPSTEDVMEIVEIKYSEVTELATMLETVIGATGGAATSGAAATRGRTARRRQPAAAAAEAAASGGSGKDVRILPFERTNSLILVGSKRDIDSVKSLIELLDVPIEEGNSVEENIYVHYLDYADATELSGTLNSLITGSQAQNQQQDSRRTLQGSSLSQRSATRQEETAAALTNQALRQGGANVQTLANARFESEVRIVADESTNSLLITASRRDYQTLAKVIEKLDLPRRQVFVEAAILEVQINDSSQLGFSYFGAGTAGDATIIGQQSVGGPPSPVAFGAADANTIAGLGGLTTGIIGPTENVDLDGDGTTDLSVPTYGAILSAAASDRSVNVLSTPNVLTSDNEQAQIIIANNVPIPTGQTVGTSGVTTSTISREDIGITLRITPQINEGDTLRLEIFVEISNVAQGSFGIDVNSSGIVTTVRSAESVVSVKDRQPVIIGGLIQDNDNLSETKVPILGDIPLLGALFRNRNTVRDKQNLVIMITPHIVRDHLDVSEVVALEVERHKPVIESEVLNTWLRNKNLQSAQEAFRRPPDAARLPKELSPDEILITPEGTFDADVYNSMPREESGEELEKNSKGEVIAPVGGLRRRAGEAGADAGGFDDGDAGDEPAETAAPGESAAEQAAPAAVEDRPDPEEIRRRIMEERERRRREREEQSGN
ncbi:MAG: type II secretion system secretin GspD [Chrysiogenetes bacterium]|nr:type II secretion system secretin GspD [Chrysiogenetes bacterium]